MSTELLSFDKSEHRKGPSWLSVKYFQAKALETFGMIILSLVMLGVVPRAPAKKNDGDDEKRCLLGRLPASENYFNNH